MGIKRYELSERNGHGLRRWFRQDDRSGRTGADNRLFVTDVCGCCALVPIGAIFRTATASGRRCTDASVAGAMPASGAGVRGADGGPDNEYLMIDSTIVRALPISRRPEKGGQGPSAGAFPRGTDHQKTHARRHVSVAPAVPDHTRPSQRHRLSSGLLEGQRGSGARRQGV